MALDDGAQYIPDFVMAPSAAVLTEDGASVVKRSGEEGYMPPEGLARGLFDAGDGLILSYYYTTHTNINNASVATVGYSGFKSDLVLNPKEIQFLTNRNVPMAWLALHNPERSLGFLEATKMACKKFLREPPAPVQQIIESQIPTAISAHSTGSQIVVEHAGEEEHYNWLSNNFCGLALQSTMLKTSPLKKIPLSAAQQRRLFTWCASNHPHETPQEFGFGKAYMRVCGYEQQAPEDAAFIRPAMGQIEEICNNAKEQILDKNGPHLLAKGDIPVAAFIGGRDLSAYSKTQLDFFDSVGAGIFLDPNAGHAQICENKRNMVLYVRTLHEMANGTFDPTKHTRPEQPKKSVIPSLSMPRMPFLFARTRS